MVKVNDVYQTVLALANKEQRGYITPQEFNLLANQAQMSIFEQYFYDLNQFKRTPNIKQPEADITTIINDKLSFFSKDATLSSQTPSQLFQTFIIPNDFYRFQNALTSNNYDGVKIERLEKSELQAAYTSRLTRGTNKRPIMYIQQENNSILVQSDNNYWDGPNAQPIQKILLQYYRKPTPANWTYVVVNNSAVYNENADHRDFELHVSEQTELVNKILQLAGITLKDNSLYQAASSEESKSVQQQKA